MKVILKEEGLSLEFGIKNYIRDCDEDHAWDLGIDFVLRLGEPEGSLLYYDLSGKSILSCGEVDELLNFIQGALSPNGNQKTFGLECYEPDLIFKIDQFGVEITVHFWANGQLSYNHVVVHFDRANMQKLCLYLMLATGQIDQNDKRIQRLIRDGILAQ